MSNLEMLKDYLDRLKLAGVAAKIYQDLESEKSFILEYNGIKTNYQIQELKENLEKLVNEIEDVEELEQRKRSQFRRMLLDASEELAKKYGKQVFTLSIGDIEK